MPDGIGELIRKCAVAVVDVEVILLEVIIGHIEIRPAVIIEIRNGEPQSEVDRIAFDVCLLAYIREMFIVITKQLVTYIMVTHGFLIGGIKAAHGFRTVVEHEHIEVAVEVVIEESACVE